MTPVSVVIPARNAEKFLPQQLAALALQRMDAAWEVVVADNGSRDETANVVRRAADSFPVGLRLVDASRGRGINVARNEGIAAATGDAIAFCDADDIVGIDWLPNLVAGLSAHDFVGGTLEFEFLNDPQSPAWQLKGPSELQVWRGFTFVTGANFAARRKSLVQLDGFDERFRLGYCETELLYRANRQGMTLGFIPDAVVHYRLRGSLRDLVRQRFRYGRGSALLVATHPELRNPTVDALGPRARRLARKTGSVIRRATQPGTERQAMVANLAEEAGAAYQEIMDLRPGTHLRRARS